MAAKERGADGIDYEWNLGSAYYEMMCELHDYSEIEQCIEYLLQSGENGNSRAYYTLGNIYNPQVKDCYHADYKNAEKTINYYIEALKIYNGRLKQNPYSILNNLGVIFGGIKKDYVTACMCLDIARKLSNSSLYNVNFDFFYNKLKWSEKIKIGKVRTIEECLNALNRNIYEQIVNQEDVVNLMLYEKRTIESKNNYNNEDLRSMLDLIGLFSLIDECDWTIELRKYYQKKQKELSRIVEINSEIMKLAEMYLSVSEKNKYCEYKKLCN